MTRTRCVGCRKCVHACVAENNQSRDPEIEYIRVLKMPNGTFDMEKGDANYAPDERLDVFAQNVVVDARRVSRRPAQ